MKNKHSESTHTPTSTPASTSEKKTSEKKTSDKKRRFKKWHAIAAIAVIIFIAIIFLPTRSQNSFGDNPLNSSPFGFLPTKPLFEWKDAAFNQALDSITPDGYESFDEFKKDFDAEFNRPMEEKAQENRDFVDEIHPLDPPSEEKQKNWDIFLNGK